MASIGLFPQRNAQRNPNAQRNAHRNANAGTTLKRRIDNRGYNGGIGDYTEERNRYAPPQKRFRSQPQTQFQSGKIPLYHNNMSRVSQSYNYGDELITSNPSFALSHNNNSSSSSLPNINYPIPYGFGNPNPQIVPFPLPYRKLDVSFDSLPEWVPNVPISKTLNSNLVPNTNSNMVSVVSESLPQSIVVSKDLSDLLNVLNNENQKVITSEASNKLPLGLSFDDPMSLKVRHESVIKSLYSDMPRQCSSCGVRFKCQEEHSKHMDWHVRKNRTAKTTTRLGKKPQKSRDWFASVSLLLSAATGEETIEVAFGKETQKKKEEEKEQQHVVPADEEQKNCALCEEPFEDFFSHEDDDWMYKDAAYLRKNGPIVHVKCMPEKRHVKESRELPKVMSATVPLVAKAIVC